MYIIINKSLLTSLCQPKVGALSEEGIIPSLAKACPRMGRGEGRFVNSIMRLLKNK